MFKEIRVNFNYSRTVKFTKYNDKDLENFQKYFESIYFPSITFIDWALHKKSPNQTARKKRCIHCSNFNYVVGINNFLVAKWVLQTSTNAC